MVMKAVLSGDRQAIAITQTEEDIRPAQALLQYVAGADQPWAFKAETHLDLFSAQTYTSPPPRCHIQGARARRRQLGATPDHRFSSPQ